MQKISVDCLIDAAWIVPVVPAGVVLTDHSLAIRDARIEAIVPRVDAHARFAAREHVALTEHALIPGLINLHTHAAMSLMRGLADDLPLMRWLQEHIWPTEHQHVAPEFVLDGTLLACAEMLRGGVTCFNDMYFFPEAAAQAALSAHMRAAIGIIAIEFPSRYASDADDYLHKGLTTRDEYRGHELLTFCLAPHAPYTVSDKTFTRIATYAAQLDIPVHTHLHETEDEIEQSLRAFGVRPVARLNSLGLLGPNLIAVHAVHLQADEIALLAAHGCHIAHCPTSNLKLASGFAPVAAALGAGVNVGIGTDGAASNNRLDVLAEMRLAVLVGKATAGRAEAMPASQALEMATIRSARALGLDHSIGSLETGKKADVAALRLDAIETTPCFDAVSHLVYAAGRENVSHVWVNGELVLDERRLIHLDEAELRAKANRWRAKLQPS